MERHTVQQGECLHSIAYERGFFWQTLWNHAENASLRRRRRTEHTLMPGDEIFIPDSQTREESAQTDRRHRYRRRGVPAQLRIQLLANDQPRADLPYVLEVDGRLIRGTTDAEGWIRCPIPPNARHGKLRLGQDQQEEYELNLGHIDPVEEVTGIQGRLRNMGFLASPIDGELNERTRQAIRAFQAHYDLPVTGESDDATRQKLVEIHGS